MASSPLVQCISVLPGTSAATGAVADLEAVSALDQATSRWRQPPCFVTLVGAGNSMAITAGLLRSGGSGKVSPDDVPFARTHGCVVVPREGADSDVSRALPINLLSAPLDRESIAVDAPSSADFRTAQMAAALTFRGAMVMCIVRGEYETALERLAAAAQLCSAVRPRGFDGAAAAGACHLVVLDMTPGAWSYDGSNGDGEQEPSSQSNSSNYFTRLENVNSDSDGAATRIRNAQRLVVEQAFLSVTVEAVPAAEVSSGGDRFRRLVGRVVAKSRAAPVTSRAVRPLVATVVERIGLVLNAADESTVGKKTRSNRRNESGSRPIAADRRAEEDWARNVAKSMFESDFVKWASVQVSSGSVAAPELQTQHDAVVGRCKALLTLWNVSATEQRLFADGAKAQLDASVKDLKRREQLRAAGTTDYAAPGGTRYRGAAAVPTGSLFTRVFRLPPADEIPSCLKALEPQVPLQHRFWLSWTGIFTILIMLFFVVTTLMLMRKGG